MKRIGTLLLLAFFPMFAVAEGLSLTPPITDSSVIYLANLFGIVDGVLSGTGSQIMGSMFGVFNSAVLALGGIVIMYTVLVGTMNTAQEGQALGEKWSSIWIPMRSTIGLALLMPKASGYCLMQIFVMWVIVQGVGAADLVWNAALGYLNRGGVIIRQQPSPVAALTGTSSEISTGALKILTGQVCMLGIQNYLTKVRENNLDLKSNKAGPCYQAQQQNDDQSIMAQFCDSSVPDFLGSVNAVTVQSTNTNTETLSFTVDMPNFNTAPYSSLNGICGTIHWNKFELDKKSKAEDILNSDADTATVGLSRAIAIQQMYTDLSVITQRMIGNSPDLGTSTQCPGFVNLGTNGNQPNTTTCYSKVAVQQFGVPYLTTTNVPCEKPDDACQKWGSDPNIASSPLFVGTEFQSAVADYNGIMMPSLNLNTQLNNVKNATDARKFIAEAEQKGWIMAGSYFYNLIQMNGSATSNGNLTDNGTGLDSSVLPATLNACIDASTMSCEKAGAQNTCALCQMSASSIRYTGSTAASYSLGTANALNYLNAIQSLIDGSGFLNSSVSSPTFQASTQVVIKDAGNSTVNGFVNNSAMISVPGQPGISAPIFKLTLKIVMEPGAFQLPSRNFSCNSWKFFNSVCVGRALGDLFYNNVIRFIVNYLIDAMAQAMNTAVLIFLALPLQLFAVIFQYGMQSVQTPGNNPILALATMGTTFINTSMEMWLYIIGTALVTAIVPVLGVVIFALIALAMPLLIAWMGVMTAIGFSTAYYVPFVPYMNFLFGSIAWFTTVIEAMAAAPLIALGITNPEGHEAFGKGESSIMILLNVFLRPVLMIIGFVAAISLSYVSVWLINEGFENALSFMEGAATAGGMTVSSDYKKSGDSYSKAKKKTTQQQVESVQGQSGYINWAGVYAFFFASLMYISLYMIVVQNAFNLIYQLPDKVLRWIGGGDNAGQETAQWKEEAKGKIDQGSKATEGAGGAMQKQLSGVAQEKIASVKDSLSGGGKTSMTGGTKGASTPKTPGSG